MTGNQPFARHPEVPDFPVTSRTVTDGGSWPKPQYSAAFGVPGGEDASPQLSWSGAPEGTRSYAVTVYDPDAPTGSGFWHWAVANIRPDVHELPAGAGDEAGSGLPEGAYQLANDGGQARFVGAAPPAGHGEHRYFITVYALDVEDIGVPATASCAYLGFTMYPHTLARASIVVTGQIPA